MTLRDLLERRAAIAADMRAILDRPAGDGGDLSTEQQARFDALKSEAGALEQRIQRQAAVDDLERRVQGQPIAGSGADADLSRAFGDVTILDTVRAQLGTTDHGAGRARELSRELERRSGRTAQGLLWHMGLERRVMTTANSGDIVREDFRPELFVDRLRAATVVRRMGARVLSGLTGGPVAIPRLTGSVTASWTAENAVFPLSDPSFDDVTLTPKHLGVRTELSRNMVMQSSPDAAALVRDDQARVLAAGLDVAALAGAGGDAPTGIVNTAGIATVAAGGPLTIDDPLDLVAQVETDNADTENSGWVINPAIRRAILGMRDANGLPIGMEAILADRRVAVTSHSPAGTAIYSGNWADLVVGFWSELDVLVNPYAEGPYSRGNIQIRSILTADVAVRHAEAFGAITGVA